MHILQLLHHNKTDHGARNVQIKKKTFGTSPSNRLNNSFKAKDADTFDFLNIIREASYFQLWSTRVISLSFNFLGSGILFL